MIKSSRTKPVFIYEGEKTHIKFIKNPQNKNINLSQDKIYFFKTSLFTEKSKNIIEKMNSSQKKINNSNETLNEIINHPKTSFRKNNEKRFIFQDIDKIKKNEKNIIKSIYKNTAKKYIYIFNKNENEKDNKYTSDYKNQFNSLSYKNIINIDSNNRNNIIANESKNKNKTEYKKDKNLNDDKNIKIINGIKRCKLFSSITDNIVYKNKNKDLIKNYVLQNQSIIINTHLANANTNSKKNIIDKIEEIKIYDYNNKKKSKTKSKKYLKENKNITSYKYINNDSIQKKLNYFKTKTKHTKIQSFSNFDENFFISRYKFGKYNTKKNIRYDNNQNIIREDKIYIKKFIHSGFQKNNIFKLKDKDNLVINKKDKNN